MDALKLLGALLKDRVHAGGLGKTGHHAHGHGHQQPQYAPHPTRASCDPLQKIMRAAQQRRGQRSVWAQAPPPLPRHTQPRHTHAVRAQRAQTAYHRPAVGHHHHAQQHHHHALDQKAVLLIRAMINAAKSDGVIDQYERYRITSRLGTISRDESQFLQREFARPLNVHAFAHEVPRGCEQEVYAISLMAIDPDNGAEASYLRQLAECLRIAPNICNQIHHQYGAPCLF